MATKSNNMEFIDLEKAESNLNKLSEESKKKWGDVEKDLERLREINATNRNLKEKRDRKKLLDEMHQQELQNLDEQGKVLEKNWKKYFGDANATLNTLATVSDSLTKSLDSVIDKYVATQQKMTAGLIGSGTTLGDMTRSLTDALSTTNLVKQETVYNKLGELISSGIIYNVSQRAFLETLSDDIGLSLSNTSEALNRLIYIQQTDLYSNRLAIQYSLKEFLNQNYDTSTYIQKAFTSVSEALLETQALASSSAMAVGIETAAQTWLGSYYSKGFSNSTVTGLAAALNKLGSGDISGLGSGLSNLILMGVAQSGLDYGSLLNYGIDASDVDTIMRNITEYLQTINDSTSSNVVKSQLASLYGINVADLIAASKFNYGSGTVTSDISNMLSSYNSLVPISVQTSNLLDNFFYNWGTGIASNNTSLISYRVSEIISSSLGEALSGSGNPITSGIGSVLKMAPMLIAATSLFGSGGIGSLLGAGSELLGNAFGSGSNNLLNAFNALNSIGEANGSTIKISSSGVSGSAYVSNGNSSDMFNNLNNSTKDFTNSVTTGEEETEDEKTRKVIETGNSDTIEELKLIRAALEDLSRSYQYSSTL